MEEGHRYKFGQMPTRKTKFNGEVYRRLEIGEEISFDDLVELEGSNPQQLGWFHTLKVGETYNPIREHKHLIIWRKEE